MDMRSEEVIKLGVLFYITAILGYMYELVVCFIYNGNFVSHAFLSGPYLPIYGLGALIIYGLKKYRHRPLKIFVLSFLITGTFELLSGLILDKIFNIELWNYDNYKFNIGGYVCLLSAFCFGIGSLFIMYVLVPLIEKLVKKANKVIVKNILFIMSTIFGIDVLNSIIR